MTSPTIDTQSLESLLERVREATGPDRELDAAIEIAFLPTESGDDDILYYSLPSPDDRCEPGTYWRITRSGRSLRTSRKLSASLDACAALQAEKLPGSMEAVWNMEEGPGARLLIPVKNSEWKLIEATGNTVCLAWLAAILSALIAKGETV